MQTDLRALRGELLQAEIRRERADAELKELELAAALDRERDRLVRPGKTRHLVIASPIMGQVAMQYLDALEHWELRDPGEDVFVTINSPGGSVTDGLAIYDTLRRMRRKGSKVTTRGQGIVASMAGVLLQAGDERIMDARAKMLIHEGSTSFGNERLTPGEVEDFQAFHAMVKSDILDILAERSSLSRDEIAHRWSRRDWYLTAQEVVKFGFADRIE